MSEEELIDREPEEIVEIENYIDDKRALLAQKLSMGKRICDIAYELNVSEAWVRTHKKDKEVVALMRELQREAIEYAKNAITYGSVRAVETINELMSEMAPPQVRLAAAKDILDRLGFKAAERSEVTHNIRFSNLSPEERKADLKERIRILESDE